MSKSARLSLEDRREVVGAVRRKGAVGLDQRWRKVINGQLAGHCLGERGTAVDIDGSTDDHELAHQVQTPYGDNHGHVATITPTNEVNGTGANRVDEGDRVVGHDLEGKRAAGVWHPAVGPALRAVCAVSLAE